MRRSVAGSFGTALALAVVGAAALPAPGLAADRDVRAAISGARATAVVAAGSRAGNTEERFAAADERDRQRLGRRWIRDFVLVRTRIGQQRAALTEAAAESAPFRSARRVELDGLVHYRRYATLRIAAIRRSLAARRLPDGSAGERRGFAAAERIRLRAVRQGDTWARAHQRALDLMDPPAPPTAPPA